MNKPVKTKLCWNCEGSVSRTAENCPYCAVYLSPESSEEQEIEAELPTHPPKAPYVAERERGQSEVPKAPYTLQGNRKQGNSKIGISNKVGNGREPLKESLEAPSQREERSLFKEGAFREIFLPVFLLSAGSLALLFSLLLLLFAVDGHLTLQWEGEYWYVYALLSIPLLALGWKLLGWKLLDRSE